MFLSDFGRGTFAVAVLGSGLVACSSDTPGAATDSTAGADPGSDQTTRETTEATAEESAERAAEAGALRWERADFGFVSAYVLARGNEVAIVDTGTDGGQIEVALGALSLGWDDVDHVIVTHAHGDHVGGLDVVLASASSAVGYVGSGDIDQVSAARDLTAVDDGDEIFGLNVIGTPGHTAGHISVFDPGSGLLVAGDAVLTEGGTLSGPSAQFSDDISLAEASVKAMADGVPGARAIETILAGHGSPITDGAADQLTALAQSL